MIMDIEITLKISMLWTNPDKSQLDLILRVITKTHNLLPPMMKPIDLTWFFDIPKHRKRPCSPKLCLGREVWPIRMNLSIVTFGLRSISVDKAGRSLVCSDS